QLRGVRWLDGALTAVTAAVVGVVLNLAVWFGLQVFLPLRGGVDWFAVAVAVAAFVALQRFKVGVVPVILVSGALGLVAGLL
ncbi:MAG TPA: chromate transporter, partial [Opitutaceae bacterium]|nr:chromate transporter [Opitutaceae bacterium]